MITQEEWLRLKEIERYGIIAKVVCRLDELEDKVKVLERKGLK